MNIYLTTAIISLVSCRITSKSEYVDRTLHYMSAVADFPMKKDQKFVLETIYDVMGSSDLQKLLLFTSAAIHNTSGFTSLVNYGEDSIYKNRGLMQISGSENYKKVSDYSKDWDYTVNYEMLGSLCPSAIEDSIVFFERLLKREYTLDNYLIKNWMGKYKDIKDRQDIKRFKSIIDSLKKAYYE